MLCSVFLYISVYLVNCALGDIHLITHALSGLSYTKSLFAREYTILGPDMTQECFDNVIHFTWIYSIFFQYTQQNIQCTLKIQDKLMGVSRKLLYVRILFAYTLFKKCFSEVPFLTESSLKSYISPHN